MKVYGLLPAKEGALGKPLGLAPWPVYRATAAARQLCCRTLTWANRVFQAALQIMQADSAELQKRGRQISDVEPLLSIMNTAFGAVGIDGVLEKFKLLRCDGERHDAFLRVSVWGESVMFSSKRARAFGRCERR